MENNRAYLLRTEITKSHLNNRICQHCGVKTSTVTTSFYYVLNISLSCNINIPSFIGNLWWDLLLGNHLNNVQFLQVITNGELPPVCLTTGRLSESPFQKFSPSLLVSPCSCSRLHARFTRGRQKQSSACGKANYRKLSMITSDTCSNSTSFYSPFLYTVNLHLE